MACTRWAERGAGRSSLRTRMPFRFAAAAFATTLAACGPAPAPADATPRLPHNPYAGNAAAMAAGAQLYATRSCAACHGVDGNGGMGPSLRNDTWIYGNDDALLFELVRSGSVAFRARGHARLAQEAQRGDMPPLAGAVDEDELWKILAWLKHRDLSMEPAP
jgi:mono/diheme cytochrome c family protein